MSSDRDRFIDSITVAPNGRIDLLVWEYYSDTYSVVSIPKD